MMRIFEHLCLFFFILAITLIVSGFLYDKYCTPEDPYFDPGFVMAAIGVVLLVVDGCLWTIIGVSHDMGSIFL